MTYEFQEGLLRYLFQDKLAKRYVTYLDETVFDLPTQQQIYLLWKDYVVKYGSVPSKANFIEFFEREIAASDTEIKPATKKELKDTITSVYVTLKGDTDFIEDVIVDFASKKKLRKLANEMTDKLPKAGDKQFDRWFTELGKIHRIRQRKDEMERHHGGLMVRDHKKMVDEDDAEGMPIFLNGINKMTAAGGFYSPQNIVFMKGAKMFGTGLLLNIAWDLVRSGHKVFYADTENGIKDIRARFKQVVLGCERNKIKKYTKQYHQIMRKVAALGGEFVPDFFPAGKSTLDDVDDRLQYYKEEKGFVPDMMVNDWIDKFLPNEKGIREKREKIQNVYDGQIRLNEKWRMWSCTVSSVTGKEVLDKWHFTTDDFGDDKQKAYNCHAAFAICRIDAELRQGTAHITPVVQRSGVRYNDDALTTCAISINEATMEIEEMDSESYLMAMQEFRTDLNTPAAKKKKPVYVNTKGLKDE